jgi:translation initiation factor IF-1
VSKDDLIPIQGVVTKVHPGGNFTVKLEQGTEILARVCGRMRRHRIRILLGDRVTVGVSPYDPTRGLITYRGQ